MLRRIRKAGQKCTLNRPLYCPNNGEHLSFSFSEWDEKRSGFVEIDLVSHDAGSTQGDFLYSLDATNVASGWTETEPVCKRAHVWTFQALEKIRQRLPFKLLGIDSDNDSAFINAHLICSCHDNKPTLARTRSYKKNDICYIEQ